MNDSKQSRLHRLKYEIRDLLRLAAPIIANNIALAGMTFTDTVMAGRISARDLAAVSVGNAVFFSLFLFGLGNLMAMSPITAQSTGAARQQEVGGLMRQCLWLSQGLALLMIAGSAECRTGAGRDRYLCQDFRGLASDYIAALCWGLPAIFAYLVLRFTSEGLGHTRPIAFVAIAALIINVIANYVLMYGKLGFPGAGRGRLWLCDGPDGLVHARR